MAGVATRQTGKNDYGTPPEIFDFWHKRNGFTIDGAANEQNHLCDRWFGPGGEYEDAFHTPLLGPMSMDSVWCNPPYRTDDGKPWVGAWVALMAEWADAGARVTGLVKSDTGTRWWNDIVMQTADRIWFVTPRINFVSPATGLPLKGNDHPSAIIEWLPGGRGDWGITVGTYNWKAGELRWASRKP